MNINNGSAALTASAVWAAGGRTLSTLVNAGVTTQNASSILAVGATLDLRPPALQIRYVWFIAPTVAPGDTLSLGLYDGTTLTVAFQGGSGGVVQMTMMGNAVLGPAVKSNASVGTTYVYVTQNFD